LLRLNESRVRSWADEQGFADLSLAELDYRLVQVLRILYGNSFLAKRLYLKGGTAINKLYLKATPRLSVDLDFNHIGSKDQVLRERGQVREEITTFLKAQDPSYDIQVKRKYEQTTLNIRYRTLMGTPQHFKMEISHIERFPILEPVEKQFETSEGPFGIATYQLEELTATKLRALFERFKGRDIYDLYFVSKLEPEPTATRKLFLYYFYRSRKVFNPKVYFRNLGERYSSGSYIDDVSRFVKPTVQFSLKEAAGHAMSYCSFLGELDERDKDFLALARLLLDREIAKKKLDKVKQIKHPIEHLFGDLNISKEAKEISTDQIRLYSKKKQHEP